MEVEPAAFASAGKLRFLTSSIHCPPFQLNDDSMAAFAEESGSEKVMKLQQSIKSMKPLNESRPLTCVTFLAFDKHMAQM